MRCGATTRCRTDVLQTRRAVLSVHALSAVRVAAVRLYGPRSPARSGHCLHAGPRPETRPLRENAVPVTAWREVSAAGQPSSDPRRRGQTTLPHPPRRAGRCCGQAGPSYDRQAPNQGRRDSEGRDAPPITCGNRRGIADQHGCCVTSMATMLRFNLSGLSSTKSQSKA